MDPPRTYKDKGVLITKTVLGVAKAIDKARGRRRPAVVPRRLRCQNDEAKYEVMVTGLQIAHALKMKRLLVQGDSKLVIDQIRGTAG
ncbi:hypothetical protein LIER_25793 [Lithospermum erythrorhizon]|uniref:RNase H type-1 domain-containing protein n=1 Tax=Lithospermum erythrorhizon TaxID=34254 RepID=A0AAV3R659_LITER